MNNHEILINVTCPECGAEAKLVIGCDCPRNLGDGYVFNEQEYGFECPLCKHCFYQTEITCGPKKADESCQE